MSGNITGTINSAASLDGVSGSQPIAPNGSLINRASPTPLPAAVSFSTWTKTSDTVATFSGLTGSTFTDGQLVAIFWAGGGYCVDGLVSGATATGFTVTFSNLQLPAGSTAQAHLPPTNTPILVSLVTQVDGLAILGTVLDMLLVQSTQPSLVELFDNSGTPVIRRTSVITAANGFDAYPDSGGQTLAQWTSVGWTTQTVVSANMYNNSTSTAVTQVVALLY